MVLSRGGNISKEGETALDIIGYAAHIAAQLGAHIIKVKPPGLHLENKDLQNLFTDKTNKSLLSNRISHIKKCAFNSKKYSFFWGETLKILMSF